MIRKSKDRTIPKESYKVRQFQIIPHTVQRMQERNISKGELYFNLTRKPIQQTKVKIDSQGRPSYRKTTINKITSAINPINKNVVSVNRLHRKDFKKIMNNRNKKRS